MGISKPTTNFRLSYAQQVQTPDYSVVLFGSNTDLAITNTNNNYGTDLDFGKSILFEFGVGHAFSDDMVLDVTVYNKDNLANAAGRLIGAIDPRTQSRGDLRLTVNQDFGNTRGLDVRLDRRIGQIFNGSIAYSYQDAKNTGTDPYTYINFGSRITSAITGNAAPPPQAAQPVGYSRPHSLATQKSVSAQAWLHPPQCSGLLDASTHPCPHCSWPAAHPTAHAPSEQTLPVSHPLSQLPQWLPSALRSTHCVPHADNPVEQVMGAPGSGEIGVAVGVSSVVSTG